MLRGILIPARALLGPTSGPASGPAVRLTSGLALGPPVTLTLTLTLTLALTLGLSLGLLVGLMPSRSAAQTAQATPTAICPPAPDITDEMDSLLALVQQAPSESVARPAMNGMWILWTRAPDDKAQALLDAGRAQIRVADHDRAQSTLSALIDYCPDYAEGYNQRAFSHFLSGEFSAALSDLDAALRLRPRHVAALSGKVLTLQALGEKTAAQTVLRAALALNPWLPERALLQQPQGTEL